MQYHGEAVIGNPFEYEPVGPGEPELNPSAICASRKPLRGTCWGRVRHMLTFAEAAVQAPPKSE